MAVRLIGSNGGTAQSLSISLGGAAPTGSIILVLAGAANGLIDAASPNFGHFQAQIIGATDSVGNAYSVIDAEGNLQNAPQAGICLQTTANLPAGAMVTVSFAQVDKHVAAVFAIDGQGTAGVVDFVSDPVSNEGGVASSPGIPTSVGQTSALTLNNDLLFAHNIFGANPGTVTPASGWTLLGQVSSALWSATLLRQVPDTAIVQAGAATWPNSAPWAEAIYAINIGAGGPQTWQGTAALIGAGSLAAVNPALRIAASAALGAAGSLVASTKQLAVSPILLGSATTTSAPSLAIQTLLNVEAGDAVVVVAFSPDATTLLSLVRDSNGNTYGIGVSNFAALSPMPGPLPVSSSIVCNFAGAAAPHTAVALLIRGNSVGLDATIPALTGSGTSLTLATGIAEAQPMLMLGSMLFTSDPGTPVNPGVFAALYEGRTAPFADLQWFTLLTAASIGWAPTWPTNANYNARILRLSLNPLQQGDQTSTGGGAITATASVVYLATAALAAQGALSASVAPAPAGQTASAALVGQGALSASSVPPLVAVLLGTAANAGNVTSLAITTAQNINPGDGIALVATQSAGAGGGAATFMSPTTYTVSSLETGGMVTVTAWGGIDFGYAYNYSLSGAPAGVSIDADLGLISIATPLAVGGYPFTVVVTNRKNANMQASFPFTLTVLQGVTTAGVVTAGSIAANQILHKTYDPHSGTYGTPPASGGDWTSIFSAIKTRILADQETLWPGGDNRLRCSIPLRGGFQYNYTVNSWAVGPQFLSVYQDAANFPGAKPQLRNTVASFSFDYEVAILQGGGGTYLDFINADPNAKLWQSFINDTAVGDTAVTLKNKANTSNLRVGRWHQVLSYDQQAGGGPPNSRYYDYVKVTAINGSTGVITLDRPLRHIHKALYWEAYPQDNISFGQARIMPWDVGGAGGVEATNTRTTARLMQRQFYDNIEFVINPNYPAGGAQGDIGTFIYLEGVIETFVTNCTIPYPVVSMTKHALFSSCTVPNRAEMDKLIETCTWANCTILGQALGDATGVEFLLVRGSTVPGGSNIAPRQLHSKGSTWDTTLVPGNASVNDFLFFTGIPGPFLKWEFENSYFRADVAVAGGNIMPIRDTSVVSTAGSGASWSGNRLIIPTNTSVDGGFIFFLAYATEGAIVTSDGTYQNPANWGYITNITSPGDGTALWLDITWVAGTRPAATAVYMSRAIGEVIIDAACTLAPGGTIWSGGIYGSGAFYKQTCPAAFGPTYSFPAAWPAGNYGFGVAPPSGGGATGATDSAGNAYTLAVADNNAQGQAFLLCNATASLPAGAAITVNFAGPGCPHAAAAIAVPGRHVALDQQVLGLTGASATSFTAPSGALSQASELMLGSVGFATAPGPFNAGVFAAQWQNNAAPYEAVATLLVNSTVSVSWQPSWPTATGYRGALITLSLSGPQTSFAAARLSGVGVLSARGVMIASARANLPSMQGVGGLAAIANILPAGSIPLAGNGALSATAIDFAATAPQLAGAGQLAVAAGRITIDAGEQLAGQGFMPVDASPLPAGGVVLVGVGGVVAPVAVYERAALIAAGGGIVAANAPPLRAATAVLQGVGGTAALFTDHHIALIPITGRGIVNAAGVDHHIGVAQLYAFGAVYVAPQDQINVRIVAPGFANMFPVLASILRAANGVSAGGGTLHCNASTQQAVRALLAGAGGLTGSSFASHPWIATASLAGAGTLAGDGIATSYGAGLLAGQGTLALGATNILFAGTATLAGLGSEYVASAARRLISTGIRGSGAVTALINYLRFGVEVLKGAGTLGATTIQRQTASAALAGAGGTRVNITWFIRAELVGTGAFAAIKSVHDCELALELDGAGGFGADCATGFIIYHAQAVPSDTALTGVVAEDYPIAA